MKNSKTSFFAKFALLGFQTYFFLLVGFSLDYFDFRGNFAQFVGKPSQKTVGEISFIVTIADYVIGYRSSKI